MINIARQVSSRGSIAITAKFYDFDNGPVEPESVSWTLTTEKGAVINDRVDVPVSPSSEVTIMIYGDDVDIADGKLRLLTITAIYDSVYAENTPVTEQALITVAEWVNPV